MTINFKEPCIVAPTNAKSLEKLYRGEFIDLECEYINFPRKTMYELFDTGFFDFLNKKYDLLISDYEQEDIVSKEILKSILNFDISKFKNKKQSIFWDGFEKCITIAIKNDTALFFFF